MFRYKYTFLNALLPLFALAVFTCFVGAASVNAAPIRRYSAMDKITDKCGLTKQLIGQRLDDLAPTNTLCVNGSLALTDPDFDRPAVSSNVNGGIGASCTLGGNVTDYDVYSFNITGCAVFPTDITITTCGPAGCAPTATDTTMYLYRNVPAGDPLQANGGLPGVFNGASPCTNLRGANSVLTGGTSNTPPNGNSCNQVTAVCVGVCGVNNNASGMARRLGNGRFTIVITENAAGDTGSYNLHVDAPAAGCTVALAPSAAGVSVSGRVLGADGRAVRNAMVTMTDPNGSVRNALTSAFGYYRFDDVEAGVNYVIGVASKTHQFAPRIVMVANELTDVDFIAEGSK
jgi:hypothetical protein